MTFAKMTPAEQKEAKRNIRAARIELAKEQTPSTSLFVWFIPAFLALAWMCKTDAGQEIAQAIPELHFVKQQAQVSPYARYPHGDPSCGGEFWCFAGWRL